MHDELKEKGGNFGMASPLTSVHTARENMDIARNELDGLYLIYIGVALFLLLGLTLQWISPLRQADFATLYWPTHCLVDHCDPYNEIEVVADSKIINKPTTTRMIYSPTVFVVIAPLIFLPWSAASAIWSIITIGSLIGASFLIWNVGKNHSPHLSGALIAFLIANSEVIAILTNAAAFAIGLCVFGCWSFVTEKYVKTGVFCFALSLLIKPQDAGLLWLLFLIVGGSYRRRALQSLAIAAELGIPILVAMWVFFPNWFQEWRINLAFLAAKGGMADPGPASAGGHGLGAFVNLQAALSEVWDSPQFYNSVTYLVMAFPFVVLGYLLLNSKPTPRTLWIGLAATTSLSLLPVYHHVYDAKVLLLAIPACGILWAEGKRFMPVLTVLAIVFTSDFPLIVFRAIVQYLHFVVLEPIVPPVLLLLVGVGYLQILAKESRGRTFSVRQSKLEGNGLKAGLKVVLPHI